jgi:hypothetical protein
MKMHLPRSRGAMQRLWLMLRLSVLFGATVAIAGCAGTKLPASVAGGECKIFEAPKYAVRGARAYDQDWIDSNIEGGVGGCGWQRPQARPAAIDGKTAVKPAAQKPKRGIVERIKDRILPAAAPPTVAQPAPVEPPPLLPRPRDPVDELLNPSRP